jgi:hypothetical protein
MQATGQCMACAGQTNGVTVHGVLTLAPALQCVLSGDTTPLRTTSPSCSALLVLNILLQLGLGFVGLAVDCPL